MNMESCPPFCITVLESATGSMMDIKQSTKAAPTAVSAGFSLNTESAGFSAALQKQLSELFF